MNGRSEISSIPGTIVTMMLFFVLVSYAFKKGQIFLFKENPTIQEATFSNYYDKNYQVNLKDLGFKIAFGVNDYKTGEPYDDPNYVKWVVRMNDYVNQRSIKKIDVKFHKCTEADYESFYPPNPNDADAIAEITSGNYSLFCIDDDEVVTIYGRNNFYYRRFEIMMLPCDPDPARGICMNNTLEKTLDYLGNIPDIYILQNAQTFDY